MTQTSVRHVGSGFDKCYCAVDIGNQVWLVERNAIQIDRIPAVLGARVLLHQQDVMRVMAQDYAITYSLDERSAGVTGRLVDVIEEETDGQRRRRLRTSSVHVEGVAESVVCTRSGCRACLV